MPNNRTRDKGKVPVLIFTTLMSSATKCMVSNFARFLEAAIVGYVVVFMTSSIDSSSYEKS